MAYRVIIPLGFYYAIFVEESGADCSCLLYITLRKFVFADFLKYPENEKNKLPATAVTANLHAVRSQNTSIFISAIDYHS